jgi:hypothetical protein
LGRIDLNVIEPDYNDGNFRALLRMRMSCGDKHLIDHIKNQSLNAMYISPRIQNNFIEICDKIIQDNIVCKINAAKSFSVLVDETTDISRIEQLTHCIRYLDLVETTETINYVLR